MPPCSDTGTDACLSAMQMTDAIRLALDIGEQILVCGGEIDRVEDTVARICTAYGAARADVGADGGTDAAVVKPLGQIALFTEFGQQQFRHRTGKLHNEPEDNERRIRSQIREQFLHF